MQKTKKQKEEKKKKNKSEYKMAERNPLYSHDYSCELTTTTKKLNYKEATNHY